MPTGLTSSTDARQETRPSKHLSLAVIPGDGIGPEVVGATVPLIRAALPVGTELEITEYDWGSAHYQRSGSAMPIDGPERLRGHDAILFGAVGDPSVPDAELIQGLIIRLRQSLDLSVNLRPVMTIQGLSSPIATTEDIDILIVRENTEGEYVGIGGSAFHGTDRELGLEVAVHSRHGVERVTRFAFEQAQKRTGHLTAVSKINVLRHGYGIWLSAVERIAEEFPEVRWDHCLVDAMAARMVSDPESMDVVLCSNLFGDILADLASCLMGGLGLAPSANISAIGQRPGLFESVHGSAPDIAGKKIANPTACILSAALMLEHCAFPAAAQDLRRAVEEALAEAPTRDLGGTATTEEFASLVLSRLT